MQRTNGSDFTRRVLEKLAIGHLCFCRHPARSKQSERDECSEDHRSHTVFIGDNDTARVGRALAIWILLAAALQPVRTKGEQPSRQDEAIGHVSDKFVVKARNDVRLWHPDQSA